MNAISSGWMTHWVTRTLKRSRDCLKIVAVMLFALVFLGACATKTRVITGDRVIGKIRGAVQVQLKKDGPVHTWRSEPGRSLYAVSGVWMQERAELERALRFHLARCRQESGAARPYREYDFMRPVTDDADDPILWSLTHP